MYLSIFAYMSDREGFYLILLFKAQEKGFIVKSDLFFGA